MHNEEFQKLEGSWRGLHHLVSKTETGETLKLRVLNCSKRDLFKNFDKATEFDQSALFKMIYETEFGSPGGAPYGALVGDYEFENHPDDIALLENVSGVAAAAFCPFLSAASPKLLGFRSWQELSKPRDLKTIVDSAEHAKWMSFRDSDDSRFVVLTAPRTLARLPYGKRFDAIESFAFEELDADAGHEALLWANPGFSLARLLVRSFLEEGWDMRAGSQLEIDDLPAVVRHASDARALQACAEVYLPERAAEKLLSLGLVPLLSHEKRPAVRLMRMQSIADPPAGLAGPWQD